MNQPACFGSLIASHITRAVCFQPRVWVSLRFLIITSAAARALPLLPAPNLEERREHRRVQHFLFILTLGEILLLQLVLFCFIHFYVCGKCRLSSPVFVLLAAPLWCFSKRRQRKDALCSLQQKELVRQLS